MNTSTRCDTCNGIGEVPMHHRTGPRSFQLNWERCRDCDGTGQTATPRNQDRAVLLERALAENLIAKRTDLDAKVALVSSSQNPNRWYRVTRTSCECKAHQRWGVCKHQVLAAHRYETGELPYRPHTARVQAGWQSNAA